MSFQIRPMTEADWTSVSAIYQQGIDTNLATFQATCPEYAEWDAAHLQACRLVICEAAEVVGWVALSPVSSRCVYAGVAEVSIYIADHYKGCGAGSALLREMARRSEEEGFWMLQSSIMANNAPSLRLHERCGYRLVGVRERIGRDRFGQWRDTVLMERRSEIVGV